MRYTLLIIICCISLISCNNQVKKPTISIEEFTQFTIAGKLDKPHIDKVYLNTILGKSLIHIDSSQIIDGEFYFSGVIDYPDRYALSFETDPNLVIFVLENNNIEINFEKRELNDPYITGSPLNTKLEEYKLLSRSIFKEIDNLYPEFQRARLENDVEKLESIGKEMKRIEKVYRDFSFDYIQTNRTSFIAAIVLSDHLKSEVRDSIRIRKNYMLLSDEVKRSPAALLVADYLKLP